MMLKYAVLKKQSKIYFYTLCFFTIRSLNNKSSCENYVSVIYSLQELLFDVHFWIGQYSSQDEYGTAAYKTVELDTLVSTVHVVDIGRSAGIYTILLP